MEQGDEKVSIQLAFWWWERGARALPSSHDDEEDDDILLDIQKGFSSVAEFTKGATSGGRRPCLSGGGGRGERQVRVPAQLRSPTGDLAPAYEKPPWQACCRDKMRGKSPKSPPPSPLWSCRKSSNAGSGGLGLAWQGGGGGQRSDGAPAPPGGLPRAHPPAGATNSGRLA